MSNYSIIASQIKQTLLFLQNKYSSSGEAIVKNYIALYQSALDAISDKKSNEEIQHALKKLLNCARGYLETSSDYNQEFLKEMAKTEKIIKNIGP